MHGYKLNSFYARGRLKFSYRYAIVFFSTGNKRISLENQLAPFFFLE